MPRSSTTARGKADQRQRGAAGSLQERLRAVPTTMRPVLARVASVRDLWRSAAEPLDPARVASLITSQMGAWLPLDGWAVFADEWTTVPRLLSVAGLGGSALDDACDAARRVFRSHGDACLVCAGASSAGSVIVGLPLVARGRTRAALVGVDRAPGAGRVSMPAAAHRALVEGLDLLALSLDTALRMERAEALSVTDDLTQLYNSRFLSQVLRRETKRALRGRRSLSLLFLDLDGFKDVNDTFGHLSGSRTLAEAADLLRQSARESDMVVRFGGDEFAVVLPDTEPVGARLVAERIRARIAEHVFLASEGASVRLTVSVGVASLPGGAATAEALIQAADRAMYRVKSRGKNGIHEAPARSRPAPP